MKYLSSLLLFSFLLVACHEEAERSPFESKSEAIYFDVEELTPPLSQEPQKPPNPLLDVPDQKLSKIIKDGSISLEVDSLLVVKSVIDDALVNVKGYYENEVYTAGDYYKKYTLKIRIPNKNFVSFVNSISNVGGEMTSKNINARDVTAEYVDLEIRLANNKAYLETYQKLLTKATKVSDILEIQEKARRIESEIDAQMGRMKYIIDQVKYSTLTLNVNQRLERVVNRKKFSFLADLGDAIYSGFIGFKNIILGAVMFWPMFLFAGLGFVFVRRWRRKRTINGLDD